MDDIPHAAAMVQRPATPKTRPAFAVPRLACDCHVHVIGPHDRSALSPERTYTPPEASLEALQQCLDALGFERVVIVHPSVYGTDCTITLDAIRRFDGRARGIAVLRNDMDGAELADMHRAGMRGVRVNFLTVTEPPLAEVEAGLHALAARIAPLGWHVQLFARLGLIARLGETIASLPVPVVADHFAWATTPLEPLAADLSTLCDLLADGNFYVKLSAAHRLAPRGVDDPAMMALARRFIAANPRRLLWGSDWPHTAAFASGRRVDEPGRLHDIDDGHGLNQLAEWAGEAHILRSILVDNPARLYDFR